MNKKIKFDFDLLILFHNKLVIFIIKRAINSFGKYVFMSFKLTLPHVANYHIMKHEGLVCK